MTKNRMLDVSLDTSFPDGMRFQPNPNSWSSCHTRINTQTGFLEMWEAGAIWGGEWIDIFQRLNDVYTQWNFSIDVETDFGAATASFAEGVLGLLILSVIAAAILENNSSVNTNIKNLIGTETADDFFNTSNWIYNNSNEIATEVNFSSNWIYNNSNEIATEVNFSSNWKYNNSNEIAEQVNYTSNWISSKWYEGVDNSISYISGGVGIGTTPIPDFALTVVGNGYVENVNCQILLCETMFQATNDIKTENGSFIGDGSGITNISYDDLIDKPTIPAITWIPINTTTLRYSVSPSSQSFVRVFKDGRIVATGQIETSSTLKCDILQCLTGASAAEFAIQDYVIIGGVAIDPNYRLKINSGNVLVEGTISASSNIESTGTGKFAGDGSQKINISYNDLNDKPTGYATETNDSVIPYVNINSFVQTSTTFTYSVDGATCYDYKIIMNGIEIHLVSAFVNGYKIANQDTDYYQSTEAYPYYAEYWELYYDLNRYLATTDKKGEWFYYVLPEPVSVSASGILRSATKYAPHQYVLYSSDDGVNWTQEYEIPNMTYTNNYHLITLPSPTLKHKYFGICITKLWHENLSQGDYKLRLDRWDLYFEIPVQQSLEDILQGQKALGCSSLISYGGIIATSFTGDGANLTSLDYGNVANPPTIINSKWSDGSGNTIYRDIGGVAIGANSLYDEKLKVVGGSSHFENTTGGGTAIYAPVGLVKVFGGLLARDYLTIATVANPSSVETSHNFYCFGTSYFKNSVEIDDDLTITNGVITAPNFYGGGANITALNYNNISNPPTIINSKWSDGTSGQIYYNGGNVGIGTTNPNALLHIQKNTVGSILSLSTNNSTTTVDAPSMEFTRNNDAGTLQDKTLMYLDWDATTSAYNFNIENANIDSKIKIRVDSGNKMILQDTKVDFYVDVETSAAFKCQNLHLMDKIYDSNGDKRIDYDDHGVILYSSQTPTLSSTINLFELNFYNQIVSLYQPRFEVRTDGDVHMIKDLHVWGTVYASENASDVRIKINITDHQTDIEKFKELRITKYDRTDKVELKGEIGLIAQELKEVFPECVSIGKNEHIESIDDFHYIHPAKLTFNLISVVQQLINRIEVLEQKIINKKEK